MREFESLGPGLRAHVWYVVFNVGLRIDLPGGALR